MELAKCMTANTVLYLDVIQLHSKINQHSMSSITNIQNIRAL